MINKLLYNISNEIYSMSHVMGIARYAVLPLTYLAKLCYICHLWPNCEIHLFLFNIGHMVYVLDWFFDTNSMAVSIW